MDQTVIYNALIALGNAVDDLQCGRVTHQDDRRQLRHAMQQVAEAAAGVQHHPEHDMGAEATLLQKAEQKIVDQQTTIGTQANTITDLTTSNAAKDKTITDLQTQLAAAGTSTVDAAHTKDAADVSEEQNLQTLLDTGSLPNPNPGSNGATVTQVPPPATDPTAAVTAAPGSAQAGVQISVN